MKFGVWLLLIAFIHQITSKSTDTHCADHISIFKKFSNFRFDLWHIKKAAIKFIPHPHHEMLLYSPINVIKCDYNLVDVIINRGIAFYADASVKEFCKPFFVPFSDFDTEKPLDLTKPMEMVNHTVVLDVVYKKYIILYTCLYNPDTLSYETGVVMFVEREFPIEMFSTLEKILKEIYPDTSSMWTFEDNDENQCICEHNQLL